MPCPEGRAPKGLSPVAPAGQKPTVIRLIFAPFNPGLQPRSHLPGINHLERPSSNVQTTHGTSCQATIRLSLQTKEGRRDRALEGIVKKIGLLKIDKESKVLSTVNIEIIKIISHWAF